MSLNEEQASALRYVLDGKNIFLTGSAGVGKSYALCRIIDTLKANKTCLPVLAPTGVAACNISGTTIHSYFSIPLHLIEPTPNKAWTKFNILIIDEVSLITPSLFIYMDKQARISRVNNQPFGGVQLILCGDFFQLPCITKKSNYTGTTYIFETRVWQQLNLRVVNLVQVYRQSDLKFIRILQKIRVGCVDYDVCKYMQALQEKKSQTVHTILSCHKKRVADTNSRHLRMLPGRSHFYKLHMRPLRNRKSLPPVAKRTILNMMVVPELLELKKNTRVMIPFNIDIKQKLVNGTMGIVKDFTPTGFPIVTFSHCTMIVRPIRWKTTWKLQDILVLCIPLIVAHSMTIHKSQGSSIDHLCVDLQGIFTYGQAYVALSRATTPDELCVQNWKPGVVKTCPKVKSFYETIKNTQA